MTDSDADDPVPVGDIHGTPREAKRAQLALNVLVVFSAVAGSFFFAYVLYTIRPFADRQPPAVEVPTSKVGERVGVLSAYDEEAGLSVLLRDVDEAPGYRRELSETMRTGMGITKPGRVYTLVIRNHSGSDAEVVPSRFAVNGDGGDWPVRWIGEVADESAATAAGRMRIAQSESSFTLGPGQERQLYVFVVSKGGTMPPPAEGFTDGTLKFTSGAELGLVHEERRVGEP